LHNENLLQASNILKKMNILFTYTGSMEHSNIENLCSSVESYFKTNIDNKNIISKMLSITIELTQNIQHYLKKKELTTFFNKIIADSVVVCFGRKNESFFIYAGNWIENVDVAKIENVMKHLYNMTENEINTQYRMKMHSINLIDEENARMGLLQLFRKSQKVEHEVIPKDIHWSFIVFKVTL